jgi:hypothetical protein
LIKGEDVKYIKARRIKWWGHLSSMEVTKLVKKITDWNSIGIRTEALLKNKWRDEAANGEIKQRMER